MCFICGFLLLVSCEKLEWIPSEGLEQESSIDASDTLRHTDDYLGFEFDSMDFVMSNDVLERAYKMASVDWTPVNPVPKNGGGTYPKGRTVRGIPYSSVREINTYLFQDVSYHTFMTAVHNPKSVLYTENISKAPYHGTNCAPYYGAVCSSAVMYAFGIDIPYYVSQIKKLPILMMLEDQTIDSLRVCDVILKSGHVQMIFDVEHRADTLYRISTFESAAGSARIVKYSKEKFLKMWNSGKYVGYRYKKLKYSEETADFRRFDPIAYNNNLCPSKGDKSVYRTTDTVTINIFNPSYDRIVLMSGSNVVSSESYDGEIHKYHDLLPGIYSVFLQKEDNLTAEVSFEIIETDVSCSDGDDKSSIAVSFHTSADPVYVTMCDLVGNSFHYHRISSLDKERGYVIIPRLNRPEVYCKVIFKGEYGRIINEPLRIY